LDDHTVPSDEVNIRILDFRAEKIRSAIRLAYNDLREAMDRALSDFKARVDDAALEIRQLDDELERTILAYAEQHDSDYLLRRVIEGRKAKQEAEQHSDDDEPK
jgi:phosphate uptake regulator